jgi:hypothetical protein
MIAPRRSRYGRRCRSTGPWLPSSVTSAVLRLGIAAAVVVGGPLLAALFRGSSRAEAPAPGVLPVPRPAATSPPLPARRTLPPLTAEQAYARELLDLRDRPLSR